MAVALALPESGCLVACERDARSLEVAKKYYELAGVSHKVMIYVLNIFFPVSNSFRILSCHFPLSQFRQCYKLMQ